MQTLYFGTKKLTISEKRGFLGGKSGIFLCFRGDDFGGGGCKLCGQHRVFSVKILTISMVGFIMI